MKTPRNNIHVYNFGFFYLPSFQDGTDETYTDVQLENGRLQAWEGDLEARFNDRDDSTNWPII